MNIETNLTAIVIPFEDAIALYNLGLIDSAFLANVLPAVIAEQQCPEILKDGEEISKVAYLLSNQ